MRINRKLSVIAEAQRQTVRQTDIIDMSHALLYRTMEQLTASLHESFIRQLITNLRV